MRVENISSLQEAVAGSLARTEEEEGAVRSEEEKGLFESIIGGADGGGVEGGLSTVYSAVLRGGAGAADDVENAQRTVGTSSGNFGFDIGAEVVRAEYQDAAMSPSGDGGLMASLLDLRQPPVDASNTTTFLQVLSFGLDANDTLEEELEVSAVLPLRPSYFSALVHNASASNVSVEAEALFVGYPPLLLDVAVFFCVLFVVLGVPGNLITIVALVKCKKVHNATAVFIINLTLSDLMFCLFNLPLTASLYGHRAWVHSHYLCLLFPVLRYGLVAVSVFTVLAITINRYVMIAHPRLYNKLYTRTLLAVMVVSTWVGAFGALVPTMLDEWGTFGLDPSIGSCSILPDRDGNSPKVFLFIFAFLLPCGAIVVCYIRIFLIVHRADKRSHGARQGFMNGKKKKRRSAPAPDPPTLHTIQNTPTNDRLQLETLVKLSTSRNSVRVEIVEPGENGEKNKNGERKNGDKGEKGVNKRGPPPARTPSPLLSAGEVSTDGSSLLKTEVNGFSGHPSEECVATASSIRVCPPTAPASPASDKSECRGAVLERRPSTISGLGVFSHLRGTIRKTRAGSFMARHPGLSPKDRRLLKMILVIFISFVTCYLPITLVKTFSKDDNPVLNVAGVLLIYMTTCINPIIYVVMSSEYRQAYVSLLTCRRDPDAGNRSVTKIS